MKNAFLRRLSAMLTAALLLSTALLSAASATAADQAAPIATEKLFHSAYDAQLVQDTLYLLLEDKLVALAQGQEEPTTILHFSEYPELNSITTLLASDGSALYALDSWTGAFYEVDESALQPMATLDLSELGEEREDGERMVLLQYPVVQNGFLYVLSYHFSDFSKTLYRFSLETGIGSPMPTDDYMLQEIIAYQDGQLLAFDFTAPCLVSIDMETGKAVGEPKSLPSYGIDGIAYDSAKNQIYFRSGIEVMRWESKKPVAVGYLLADSTSNPLDTGIWNGQYTVIDNTGRYECATASEAIAMKPLTIWSDSGDFLGSDFLSKFMKLYPQTPVVLRGSADENSLERVSTANVTGDGSVDIFAVSNILIDGPGIFKRGYAAPLDSVVLKDDVLSMYPQIQEYLMRDGVLYGFPVDLWTNYWLVQPELLEDAQLGDVPKSIEDYYDMMLSWYEENYNDHPTVTFDGDRTVQAEWRTAIHYLISQYVYTYGTDDRPITFDTPVFRSALEKVAALSRWKGEDTARNPSAEAVEEKSIFIIDSNATDPFSRSENLYHPGARYILPPSFEQAAQPILDAYILYFVVNPYSRNKEAAIQFLEFFSQNMPLVERYQFHPNDDELVERESYQDDVKWYNASIAAIKGRIAAVDDESLLPGLKDELAQEEAAFAREEENRWEYSAQTIAEYRKLAPYMRFDQRTLLWSIADSLDAEGILMQYFEGLLTLDQALKQLDRKVSMMYLEGQ